MFEVSRCKVAYLLTVVTVATILVLNNGSWASASPASRGDAGLTADNNKNLASFAKRNDNSDLLAVASTGSLASASASAAALASSSSQLDDKDLDDLQDKRDIVSSQKRPPIVDDDRASSSRRDRERASAIDRAADIGNKKDEARDEADYDDEQRDQRHPIRAHRGRDRSRHRGRNSGNNRRYDEEDNEEPATSLDRYCRRHPNSRRCSDDDDDDDSERHRLSTFGSLFEPMFDMMRRMPIDPSGVSASSSVSSSDSDGLSRSSGTFIHNGRLRGFFSETGRDGRTRTKYIGDDEDN